MMTRVAAISRLDYSSSVAAAKALSDRGAAGKKTSHFRSVLFFTHLYIPAVMVQILVAGEAIELAAAALRAVSRVPAWWNTSQ